MLVQSYPNDNANTNPLFNEPVPPVVAAIGDIGFTGNLIPHSWYRYLKLPSGHPDLVGITLLAEIVYQYRPGVVRDERTGEPLYVYKRFKWDKFCAPISYFEKKFELTTDQIRQALKRLEHAGFITREYRDIEIGGIRCIGMTFVEPVPERIQEITCANRPDHQSPLPGAIQLGPEVVSAPGGAVSMPQGAVSVPGGAVYTPPYKDYSKITSEASSKTTTPPTPSQASSTITPSSSSRGSKHDQKHTKLSDTKLSDTKLSDTKLSEPVQPTDTPNSGKLIFPEQLSPREQQEAARLVTGQTQAQELLDELAAYIQAKAIRLSPLACLRGMVAKAQQDEFHPEAGLRITEQRLQNQHRITTANPVEWHPSNVWQTHWHDLEGIIPSEDFNINILPLRGVEDNRTLWLEAPNTFVASWVTAHLEVIKQTLQPHTPLPIQVRIG